MFIPENEITFEFSRSSGPGGQNVNKVNTKVRLRWNITGSSFLDDNWKVRFLNTYKGRINLAGEVVIESDQFRTREMNIEECRKKLSLLILSVKHPTKKRIKTRVSAASIRKRIEAKRKRAATKSNRKKMQDSSFDE